MERNFSKPNRFREEKEVEEVNWRTIKEVSHRPLKKMSHRIGKSMIGDRRLGTKMFSKKR